MKAITLSVTLTDETLMEGDSEDGLQKISVALVGIAMRIVAGDIIGPVNVEGQIVGLWALKPTIV